MECEILALNFDRFIRSTTLYGRARFPLEPRNLMTPETLIQIQNIIEKFGFPVFVALCGLLLFAAVFRYMTRALEKKDCDFKDYVEKRDAQIDSIVEKHNQAFRENTQAINQMRLTLEARLDILKEHANLLHKLTNGKQ